MLKLQISTTSDEQANSTVPKHRQSITDGNKRTREGDRKMENQKQKQKKKIVVVMGASGAGKSKLAIDIVTFVNDSNGKVPFPRFEIVNADSMQVYRGLDVLTNKVPLRDRKGVPHHLMGTIDPNVEFTSKLFRDLAIPIIDDILARGCVPIIVGGTNFYIQALVSPFLIDDIVVDLDECLLTDNSREDSMPRCIPDQINQNSNNFSNDYNLLKEIDPVAANRIHPNDHRKVKHYLSLYSTSGILPSELFQGKTSGKWGQPERFRYDCCFVLVDASLPAIDKYVDDRVDSMIEDGLLDEVFNIYQPTADYTRGLRQAIGVREFEVFFSNCLMNNESIENNGNNFNVECSRSASATDIRKFLKGNLRDVLDLVDERQKALLNESINNLKTNTRRLVRRQKRRFNQLRTLFGWELHCFDSTEALRGTENYWQKEVVEPCISLVKTFLHDASSSVKPPKLDDYSTKLEARDLWTQYVCKPCGDRILRGAHEWEQHKIGRNHRKRVSAFRKKYLCSLSKDTQVTDDLMRHP